MEELVMSGKREKDFSMPLSDLGEPDKGFCRWWPLVRAKYLWGAGNCPGFAKWTVQEAVGEPRPWFRLHHDIQLGFIQGHDDEGHGAEVHFTGKLLDGTVFASSRESDNPLIFIPTKDDVMQGFSLAISSMQPGEKAVFTIPADLALTRSGSPASIPWNIPLNQTLRFDIELVTITTDILHNQGILKKIIKFGADEKHPRDLDEVFVNYNACLKDGTSVSKSDGVEFSLAEGFFCPAFAHALKTMAKGEEAVLVIKPEYGFGEQSRPSIGNEAAVPPDATLYVSIQLMSWETVSHIGENRNIIKKTSLRTVHGYKRPRNQSVVQVRLTGKLQDGTVFDRRGHDGEEPFEFTIDEEHVIYGLDEAVMTMHDGEVSYFTIPPELAFGSVGSNQYQLAVVPPNCTVIYEIELVSVVNEERSLPWEITSDEGIKAAKMKEKEGDNLYKSGKYLRAYRRYLRARQILQPCFQLPVDGEIKEMLISFTLKSAECAIQLQRYKEASKRYREVLNYDPGNAKALQMVAQPLPKASDGIDTDAMHRDLEFTLVWTVMLDPVEPMSCSSMRLKHGHQPSGRTIIVPPVARPEANARQATVSTAPAMAAGQSPATPPATPAAGCSSATTASKNGQSSGTGSKPWLVSCFGLSSSRVNSSHGPQRKPGNI